MLIDVTAFMVWFTALVQAYGPWSVFLGTFIEEVIVPIPSPLVTMAAGFVLIPATAALDEAFGIAFFTIMIPGAVAMTLGSLVIYAVGYYGGESIINRFGRFLGTNVKEVEAAGRKLEKSRRIWLTIAVLRAIFIVPTSLVSIASGFMHLNWKKFAVSTFIGALPRLFILGLIGWQFGSAYASLAENFSSIENVLFVVLLLVLVGAVFYYFKRVRKRRR